ncbi:MAG TPA: ATP-binding protein [Ktedonobacteraceae bacterium]|nr:ATP-binding protein [Ktedonobacteraceae bacterium]
MEAQDKQEDEISRIELLNSELLATVGHELRGPLASIKGYTATLLRHERSISREERHEFLVAIATASNRLERIIDRLLKVSQLETGTMTIKRSPVNLAHLLHEAIMAAEQHTLQHAAGHFTFGLHLRDAAGMLTNDEPPVMADPRLLREVLDNLLENAVHYSPRGGAIDVIVRPLEQAVEICVCDHGLGIPSEHLNRIFERFYRMDTRLIRDVNGLGLGLTICKYIVELHGGVIWAESCPSGGSAFHVRLPVEEAAMNSLPLVAAKER